MESYLIDNDAMVKVSIEFSKRSAGRLMGVIGAIGSWLVISQQPSWWYDFITNLVTFYSLKRFYVLNIQYIADHNKKVLLVSYSHNGASHDSTWFRDTKVYQILKGMQDKLYRLLYYSWQLRIFNRIMCHISLQFSKFQDT